VAPHLFSHEQEIARVKVRHHCVVQRDAVVGIVGYDDIAADLLHMLLHGCEVSEDRVAARSPHQWLKNFRSSPQKDFFNNIGTKRTCRDVRLKSAMCATAESTVEKSEGSPPPYTLADMQCGALAGIVRSAP